ncbi:hypothetical protein DSECCO2_441700 [anaerobic digester metagenome]
MDEHDCSAHGTAGFKRILEEQVVIKFQTHAAQNDEVDFGLHGNSCKQLVVRLTAYRENRKLLALDQRIEHIDHGNTGSDHVPGNDALGRIDRRTTDIDHVVGQTRSVVTRRTGTVEYTPQEVFGVGNAHRNSQKTHLIPGRYSLGTTENLQGNQIIVEFDNISITLISTSSYYC